VAIAVAIAVANERKHDISVFITAHGESAICVREALTLQLGKSVS